MSGRDALASSRVHSDNLRRSSDCQRAGNRALELLGIVEQSFVVTTTVEDADDRDRLADDGVRDHGALPISDRAESWAEVVARRASVREFGKTLAESDDRLSEACCAVWCAGLGNEVVKFL